MRTTKLFLAAALFAPACNWTEFDDIKDDTLVATLGKPNGDSSDFAVAIGRGPRTSTSGGGLIAYGIGDPQFFRIDLAPNGELDVKTAIEILNVTNLDQQPVVIADPLGEQTGIVTTTGNDHISYINAGLEDNLVYAQLFNVNTALAASYLDAPDVGSKPYAIGSMDGTRSFLLRERVAASESTQPRCELVAADGTTAVTARGTGGAYVTSTDYQDIVVWDSAGVLRVYDGRIFKAQFDTFCPGDMTGGKASPLVAKGEVATAFTPGIGSRIIMWKDRYAILVGHKDFLSATESFIAMYDVSGAGMPTLVGAKNTTAGLRSAELLFVEKQSDADVDQTYIVAGYPSAVVDGTVGAGEVQLIALSETDGVAAAATETLQRVGPGENDQLGRAVTVTEFNGKQIVAAGSDNKLFVYYKTNSYKDRRSE